MDQLRKVNVDNGFEAFELFDSEGEVVWLVKDDVNHRYAGLYRTDRSLPPGNSTQLPFDDHLQVIEGEVTITVLPNGPRLSVGPGEMALIPGGSTYNLDYTKLPFLESFVIAARPSEIG